MSTAAALLFERGSSWSFDSLGGGGGRGGGGLPMASKPKPTTQPNKASSRLEVGTWPLELKPAGCRAMPNTEGILAQRINKTCCVGADRGM